MDKLAEWMGWTEGSNSAAEPNGRWFSADSSYCMAEGDDITPAGAVAVLEKLTKDPIVYWWMEDTNAKDMAIVLSRIDCGLNVTVDADFCTAVRDAALAYLESL